MNEPIFTARGRYKLPSYLRVTLIYLFFSVLYTMLYSRFILEPARGTGRTVGLADVRAFLYVLISAAVLFAILYTTELRRRGEEARERQRAAQMAQADKLITLGTLVSGVAHEINNPLNFITLNIPLIKEFWQGARPILDAELERSGDFYLGRLKYSVLRERLDGMFDGIMEGTDRVRGIVTTLKDFARPDPSDMAQKVDVNEAVESAIRLLGPMISRKTDHFSFERDPATPCIVGSAQKIEQVAVNLIQNALEALPSKDAAVEAKVRHNPRGGRVTVEVRDGGSGIDPEILPRVTDPFFTTKRGAGGMGLGLAIVSQIVHDHDGSIAFESEPGRGTTVRLSFPVRAAEAAV